MLKTSKSSGRLPWWAPWLIGWGGVLLSAAALVYLWRVIFMLDALPPLPATLGVMGLFTLGYLAVFLLCRLKERGLCARAALLVLLCGLLFCFAAAPLQVPDESGHFLRMWSVSSGRFTFDYTEQYPGDVDLLVEHFPHQMNHRITYQAHEMAPAALARYRTAVAAGTAGTQQAVSPIQFMLLPYAPGALLMFFARLLGFTALGQMYAGRLANLVIYALMCYFAFRNAQKYRGVLIAFALLPLSLFMAASCSYDSLMLGACWVLASYALAGRFGRRQLVCFGLLLLLAVYIKPINMLFAALPLFVPKDVWRPRFKRWQTVLCLCALGFCVYLFAGWLDGGVLRADNWPPLPRGSGQAANPAAQWAFVLKNPLRFLAVLAHTFVESNAFLFELGRFGGMDLALPMVGGLSVLTLCFEALRSAVHTPPKKLRPPAGLSALALLYIGGSMAGIYVMVNDLYSIRVTELQPRYFLPAFLLLALAGGQLFSRVVRPRLPEGAPAGEVSAALRAERACLLAAGAVAAVAALLLFQSSWVGQWLPKSEGGWKLVNLFGWAQL